MLTVQILTLNNRPTIDRCLESAFAVGDAVVVGDIGSEDGTVEACLKAGAEVVRVDPSGGMSEARNRLIAPGLNAYLEPWEFFASGVEEVKALTANSAFYVVQGGNVSKQVRLWSSGSFKNPVFEYLSSDERPTVRPEIVVVSNGHPDRRRVESEACRRWSEKSPTSSEPFYYLACSFLAEGRLADFEGSARKYLAMDRSGGDSSILMNYYMARVEAHRGSLREASHRIIGCIAGHPAFAEFWCLLADMFYSKGKYEKAKSLYENARIIGRRRSSDDMMPVEVSKYGSYPLEMEDKCSKALKEGFLVAERPQLGHT